MKYFLYARKSSESDDRQVASIDSQIQELTKLAQKEGLTIKDIIQESKSAKAPGRPEFLRMVSQISNGDAAGIICWKLDRLARNPVDGGTVSWMLQQNQIQHIRTYERSYYPTDNVLMMNLEFGVANQFIRDLSLNTKRGMKSKAERGWYPSSLATIGYVHNVLRKPGDDEIIPDDDRFNLVRKIFDLTLQGNYSVPEIWKLVSSEWGLRTRKGKIIGRSTLYRILTDPFYYGKFEWPKGSGNWYEGKHKPMISELEYDKVQIILGRKGKPRPQTHKFAYTGLIRCGSCGAMITAEHKTKRQKNGNIHNYTYYHCTKRIDSNCSQKNIREEELERQIMNQLQSIHIPRSFYEWAIEQLKERNRQEKEIHGEVITTNQKAYKACVAKLNMLIDMRADNEISKEDFLERQKVLLKEKHRLSELLNDIDNQVDSWVYNANSLLDFATTARERFQKGTLKDKGHILSLLGSNLSLTNNILSISVEKPLVLLKTAAMEVRKIERRLEPLQVTLTKQLMWEEYERNPILLPRQDSNL